VFTLKLHKGKVIGIVIDKVQGQFYSVGNDKKLKVTSLSHQKTIAEFSLGNNSLACIGHDIKHKRLIVLSEVGELYLFSVAAKTPVFIKSLSLENIKTVRDIAMNIEQDGFFACMKYDYY
jgi:hypothetical protein